MNYTNIGSFLSSRLAYTLSFLYFTFIQCYVTVLAFYMVHQATSRFTFNSVLYEDDMLASTWNNLGSSMVLMILVCTYGVHLIASVLYTDPWHCLTSAWAYFAGTTCASNMLMVYAFCNWHDVSIGKKPAPKKSSLPEAQTQKDDKNKFIEELDRPQVDIDTIFQATVKRALATWAPPPEGDEIDVQDLYKGFRTYLVLLWVFSNLTMVLCIMSNGFKQLCLRELPDSRIWNYLLATLWGTAGLFLFRFAGSMWFLAKNSVLCCVSRR